MTDPNAPQTSPSARSGPPGIPRWVKVSGLIAALIVLVVVALMLIGGDHGPGRHTGAPANLPSFVTAEQSGLRGFNEW